MRRVCELRNFLTSVGRTQTRPTVIRTDSQSAIDALHGPVLAHRLRHIDIRMHRTRQAIDDGDIQIVKVPSEVNRADGFTKVLTRAPIEEFFHRQIMGAIDTSPTSPSAPTTPRGASQDDVSTRAMDEEPKATSGDDNKPSAVTRPVSYTHLTLPTKA